MEVETQYNHNTRVIPKVHSPSRATAKSIVNGDVLWHSSRVDGASRGLHRPPRKH